MPDQEKETIQSQDVTNMWSICNTGKSYINTITSGHKWKKKKNPWTQIQLVLLKQCESHIDAQN